MINFPGDFFSMLDYKKAKSAQGLTFVPMIGGNGVPSYLLMSEALETGKFHITELDMGGTVPWLLAKNELDSKVLIIEGEEVVGGKQNRTINVTVLLPEKSETKIPVSCVEAGRWSKVSDYFKDSERIIDYNVRAYKLAEYASRKEARVNFHPSQSVVWDAVDMTLEQENVPSETSAAYEAFLKKKIELREFLKSLKPLKNQVGLAVFLDGKFIGLDYLAPAEKFKKYFQKIMSSYMFIPDWLSYGERKKKSDGELEDVAKVLGDPREITLTDSPALGKNIYAVWKDFAAHGLVYEGHILHLTLLRIPGEEIPKRPRY